jgi:hypothetical protein
MITMINEHCRPLTGGHKGRLCWGFLGEETEGQPAYVEFDFQKVIDREEEEGDIVGFWHSHPGMSSHYSARDDRTMKAWVSCFGKPLVCFITGEDGVKGYAYFDDESEPICCKIVVHLGDIIIWVMPKNISHLKKPELMSEPEEVDPVRRAEDLWE